MNQFREHASKVLDEFLEAQEDLKNYVLEGFAKGLSLDELYDSLEEEEEGIGGSGEPMSRRDFFRIAAGLLGSGATLSMLGGGVGVGGKDRSKESLADFNTRIAAQSKAEKEASRRASQAEMAARNKANPSVYAPRSATPRVDKSKL